MNKVLCVFFVKFQFLFGVVGLKKKETHVTKRKKPLPSDLLYVCFIHLRLASTVYYIYMQVAVHARSTEHSASCQAK